MDKMTESQKSSKFFLTSPNHNVYSPLNRFFERAVNLKVQTFARNGAGRGKNKSQLQFRGTVLFMTHVHGRLIVR